MRIARFTTEDEEPRFAAVGQDTEGRSVLAVLRGDPLYAAPELTGEKVDLEDVRLLAPVIPRSKVVGVGRNYADHAAELGNEAPAEPLLFLKPNTAVIGPDDPIVLPPQSQEVHHEAELAIVIGRVCKDVPPERVRDVIYGYTCGNDVTARDLQRTDDQWTRAKGFDTFCSFGPWIDTDFDPADAVLTCRVNGQMRQMASTRDMVFNVPTLIAYVSSVMTLDPGDLIFTGTPAGVGELKNGDDVVVEIEGLGVLKNPVRKE